MPDDLTLQAMVMAELEWEPSLDAAHIGGDQRRTAMWSHWSRICLEQLLRPRARPGGPRPRFRA